MRLFVVAVVAALVFSTVPARAQGADAGAPPPEAPAAAAAPAPTAEPAAPTVAPGAAPKHEVDVTRQASGEPAPVLLEIHGYVQPAFGARNRPQALPRDRWEYGGLSSRAGIILSGTPAKDFGYVVHLSIDARQLAVITGVELVDRTGDGGADGIVTQRSAATATIFEEVSASYKPLGGFVTMRAGAMRMPFTVALRSANTALMFASRPGPNEVFQSGADLGGLVLAEPLEGRIRASVGAFTGVSLVAPPNTTSRGLVWTARFDANPLGPLPQAEIDFDRGPVRFGLGVGALYRNGTFYSSNGYELAENRDVRVSGSVRFAALGFFAQAEVLRRVVTDNVSSRPNQASGGYVQASYYVGVTKSIGLAPLGRFGLTVEDEATLPRRTRWIEGGLAFFPRADLPKPETVRVLVQYQGERRTTEDETAHAALGQLQLLF